MLYRVRYFLDRHDFAMWLAWRLPARVRMWVTVRSFADATTKHPYPTPDDLSYTALMHAAFPSDR